MDNFLLNVFLKLKVVNTHLNNLPMKYVDVEAEEILFRLIRRDQSIY